MNDSCIDKMLVTKRLSLKGIDIFWHYSAALFFLLIPLTNIYLLIKSKIENDIEVYNRIVDGSDLVWISVVIFIVVGLYKYLNLRFRQVQKSLSPEEFNSVVQLTAEQLEWNVLESTDSHVIANSHHNLGSWGESITIIKKGDLILINSICDPHAKPAVSSWGGNNKNMKVFLENVETFVHFNSSREVR